MRILSLAAVLIAAFPADAQPKKEPPSPDLRAMLEDVGHDVRDVSKGVYEVAIERDGWTVFITVTPDKGGEIVLLDSQFPEVPNVKGAPGSAFLELLQENDNVAPNFFAFNKADHCVHLRRAVNRTALTPADLKREVIALDAAVRKTVHLWRPEAFKAVGPGRANVTTAPPMAPMAYKVEKKVTPKVEPKVEPKTEPKAARAMLLGTWNVKSFERDGERAADFEADEVLSFTFADNGQLKIFGPKMDDEVVKWTLDATQSPWAIDLTKLGTVEKGIVKVEGGMLHLCYATAGGDRPKAFVAPPMFAGGMFVLAKGAAPPKKKAESPPMIPMIVEPSADKEKSKLLGKWRVIAMHLDGERVAEGDLHGPGETTTFTFAAENLTVRRKDMPDVVMSWAIDAKAVPATIDITTAGKTEKGIYQFEGETLTICFANPGEERPKRFDPVPGFRGGMIALKK